LEATVTEIEKKEVCKCENCGNEAEMVFTCTLPGVEEGPGKSDRAAVKSGDPEGKKIKGTATCAQCGNEADMWIDY
jgi:hypothetical protein